MAVLDAEGGANMDTTRMLRVFRTNPKGETHRLVTSAFKMQSEDLNRARAVH